MDEFSSSPQEFPEQEPERELAQESTREPESFAHPEPMAAPVFYDRAVYVDLDHRERVAGWRRVMLRRLAALLCTGTLAFTLTTWLLVERERTMAPMLAVPSAGAGGPGGTSSAAPAVGTPPAEAARAQLDALNRGEIREAYDLFSPQYRKSVPFEAFKALVTAHREMFRTEEEDMYSFSLGADHARVDLHVQSDNDEHYVAHYTLSRINGRWLVDELRWVNADDEDEDLTSA